MNNKTRDSGRLKQANYTENEKKTISDLMSAALQAQELFSLDELEEYAKEMRRES